MAGFTLKIAEDVTASEDAGTVLPLRDAAGDLMTYGPDARPVTLTIAGSYSQRYRDAEKAFGVRVNKLRSRGADDEIGKLMAKRAVALAGACVLAWDGFFVDANETTPLACTPDNAEAVFNAAPWLFDQALGRMFDHAGFSRPTSSP